MDTGNTYGQRIVYFRKLRGFTQAQLARMAEIKPARLSRLERDRAKLMWDEAERISLVLDQPIERFHTLTKVFIPASSLRAYLN